MNLSKDDKIWINEIWQKLSIKLEKNAIDLQDIIPYSTTNGKYTDMSKEDVGWWTNGFFGGMMWLMYNETKEDMILDDTNQSIVQKCMLSYSDGRHVDLVYADFFLCEAILKLKGSDYLIW